MRRMMTATMMRGDGVGQLEPGRCQCWPAEVAARPTRTAEEDQMSVPKWTASASRASLREAWATRCRLRERVKSTAMESSRTRNGQMETVECEVVAEDDAADGLGEDPEAGGEHEAGLDEGGEGSRSCRGRSCGSSSAGRSATWTEKRVMAAAMRSMPEWAASESMPSEPVRMPVTSLSRVMARAARTEKRAAVRFSAWGGCGVEEWEAAAWFMERSYRVCGWETVAKCWGYAVRNILGAMCGSVAVWADGVVLGDLRGLLSPSSIEVLKSSKWVG